MTTSNDARRRGSVATGLLALGAVLALVLAMLGFAPSASAHHLPAVWLGSSVNGNWPTLTSSLPANHKISYGGDWSVDLPTPKDRAVKVYAAPQNSGVSVSAKVISVSNACGARAGETSAQTRARGGQKVVVGFYNGSTKIGQAVYAHVKPSVSAGQSINRWGTTIGIVGSYTANSCWDGTHVHFELTSEHAWACYNKGYARGQAISHSNFVGFIGGNYARAIRQPCP